MGAKAVEEMREGLGLTTKSRQHQDEDIISFESLDMGTVAQKQKQSPRIEKPLPEAREWKPPVTPPEPAPVRPQAAFSPSDLWNMAEETVSKLAKEMFAKMPRQSTAVPDAEIRAMVEQAVAEHMKDSSVGAPARIPDEMLRGMVAEAVQESLAGIVKEIAGEIIEKVAWEVVPDLAAAMIRAEIERLKAEQ